MAFQAPLQSPVAEAANHLDALARSLGDPGGASFDANLARARPQWPVWPQPALSALVGPPTVVLKHLGQRWLHRFEVTVGALNAEVAQAGGPVGGPSGLSLLVERAAMTGSHGWGTTSAGTSCRMVQASDGWLAVNLARVDDVEAVPAWLGASGASTLLDEAGVWSALDRAALEVQTARLVETATLLGLPVSQVPAPDAQARDIPAVAVHDVKPATRSSSPMRVVDLSSLWAGPLCSWYLGRCGARVQKVESATRPDASRLGTPGFYRRLNNGKELVDVDVASASGLAELIELVAQADVVIEGSRPRAMAQLGIDADAFVAKGGIWCSITGYGRAPTQANRVAFGDDAAAGAGLVTYVEGQPWFVGDAAGDPISGVTAALGVLSLWNRGLGGLVEVSMAHAVGALTSGVPVPSTSGDVWPKQDGLNANGHAIRGS